MPSKDASLADRGLLTLPDETWERGRLRAEIIVPLATLPRLGSSAARTAAMQLGISPRRVYDLVRRARAGDGLVTDLAPQQSSGGKGKGRLPETVERLIRDEVAKGFATRQKRSLAALYRDIARQCAAQGSQVPARNRRHHTICTKSYAKPLGA